MSDTKVRRVRKTWRGPDYGVLSIREDPNGTHMLVPVEVWERVVQALESIVGDTSPHEFELRGRYGYPRLIKHANRALAEIGGEDE